MMLLGMTLARAFVCAFFAVLFLQSGLDKITDWKGNLDWLVGHFSKTPFSGIVPLLLGTMALSEVATGLASAAAVVVLVTKGPALVPVAAMGLACLSLLMLFTGQRIAKDYPGAASLATYFAVAVIGLWLVSSA
jgi:hypothetical protein